jgi:uncharacterized Zn finger protein
VDRGFPARPFKVTVAKTTATCKRCGADEFFSQRILRRSKTDLLLCAGCGVETSYTALLQQISDVVVERAQRVLREVQAARRRMQ